MDKRSMLKKKKIAGNKFVEVDEVYDKITRKKEDKGMKTAGIERLLTKAEKQMGYSNKPQVKGAVKGKGFVSGQKKVK